MGILQAIFYNSTLTFFKFQQNHPHHTPQPFYLDRKATENLHRHQQIMGQVQSKLTKYITIDGNDEQKNSVQTPKYEPTPVKREHSRGLIHEGMLSNEIHWKRYAMQSFI